jgi:putative tricarboxylic transport membrane protein
MFWFGIVGYLLKLLRFPLVPMILGVVLGNIAEINLNRAVSISLDPSFFLTRPWSLFFLIIAAFSAVFPMYQAAIGEKRWTLLYTPALAMCCAVPLFMMQGYVRPLIGAGLVAMGLWMIWQRARGGWKLVAPEHKIALGEET